MSKNNPSCLVCKSVLVDNNSTGFRGIFKCNDCNINYSSYDSEHKTFDGIVYKQFFAIFRFVTDKSADEKYSVSYDFDQSKISEIITIHQLSSKVNSLYKKSLDIELLS